MNEGVGGVELDRVFRFVAVLSDFGPRPDEGHPRLLRLWLLLLLLRSLASSESASDDEVRPKLALDGVDDADDDLDDQDRPGKDAGGLKRGVLDFLNDIKTYISHYHCKRNDYFTVQT